MGPTLKIIPRQCYGRVQRLAGWEHRAPDPSGSPWLFMGKVKHGICLVGAVGGMSASPLSFLTWMSVMKKKPLGEVCSVKALAMWSSL